MMSMLGRPSLAVRRAMAMIMLAALQRSVSRVDWLTPPTHAIIASHRHAVAVCANASTKHDTQRRHSTSVYSLGMSCVDHVM